MPVNSKMIKELNNYASWNIYYHSYGIDGGYDFNDNDNGSVGFLRLRMGNSKAHEGERYQLEPVNLHGGWLAQHCVDHGLQSRSDGWYVDRLYGSFPQHYSLISLPFLSALLGLNKPAHFPI